MALPITRPTQAREALPVLEPTGQCLSVAPFLPPTSKAVYALTGAQPLGVLFLPPTTTPTTTALTPATSTVGITAAPSYCYFPLHRLCAPNITQSACLHRKHFLLTELSLKTCVMSINQCIPQRNDLTPVARDSASRSPVPVNASQACGSSGKGEHGRVLMLSGIHSGGFQSTQKASPHVTVTAY